MVDWTAEVNLPGVERRAGSSFVFYASSVKVQGLFECSKVGGCLL